LKTFREALTSEDFVVTATLPLHPSSTGKEIREHIDTLKPLVTALQVGDNWQAKGHIDVLAFASIAFQHGVDPIVHLSCRDRNRLALQSSLLGASVLGVTSLLLSRGQKLPDALRGKVKGVFDTDPAQLFELAQQVGRKSDELDDSGFYFGTFVPVMKPPEDWRAAQIQKKIDAGARFIHTRPCLNIPMLRTYMRGVVRLRIPHRAAYIVELPVLTSAAMAEEIKDLYPGVRIPNKLARQVASAKDPVSAGIAIAADALSQIASIPGISGANILYDGDPDVVAAVINAAGISD